MPDTTKTPSTARASEQRVGNATSRLAGLAGPTIILLVALFLTRSCLMSQGAAERIRSLLVAVVNDRLVAQLEIGAIRQHSLTEYELEGIILTYPDGTDEGVKVIAIHRAEIALAKIPAPGEPIRFENIQLFYPQIRLIESDAGLLGLVPLLKESAPSPPDEPDNDREAEGGTLSDIVEFRRIDVRGGSIRYVSLAEPDRPMIVDDIFFATLLEPTPDEAGWYTLDLALGRQPGIAIDLIARLNLDTFLAQIARLDVSATINEDTIESLPPALQTTLTEFDARGEFHITAIGDIPLTDPDNAELQFRAELIDAGARAGGTALPVTLAQASGQVAEGGFQTKSVLIETMGGRLWGTVALHPRLPGKPLSAVVRARDIRLEDLAGEDSPLAGLLSLRGSVDLATDPEGPGPRSSLGTLTITIDQGRILSLPVLSQIASAVDTIPAIGSPRNHRAEAVIDLLEDRITIARMRFITNTIAGDISGDIRFDGTLDLEAKVGPLQKARELLGPLSLPFDAIVGMARPYRVTGPISDPRVEILGAAILSGDEQEAGE